jgi:hypothetical protein
MVVASMQRTIGVLANVRSSRHLKTYKLKHANSVNPRQWGTGRANNTGITSYNVLLLAAAMLGILPGS